jgi:hypothetical protein
LWASESHGSVQRIWEFHRLTNGWVSPKVVIFDP